MFRFERTSAVLGAILTLCLAAACTQQAATPPARFRDERPELAGAWYQVFFDTNSIEINP